MSIALSPRVLDARQDRDAGRMTARRFLVENGLSLVLVGLFVLTAGLQILTGHRAYNHEQRDHGQPAVALADYVVSGHSLSAFGENWESEFLQMAMFVWLTTCLFQKGSPEANDPYAPDEDPPLTADSPAPARRGGLALKLYENSLTITFLALFLVSFALHAVGSRMMYNEEQATHGQPPVGTLAHLGSSQFWFESMQNWQSEFLSLAAMVVLAIFLRQKGSPESKPVTSPHSDNE